MRKSQPRNDEPAGPGAIASHTQPTATEDEPSYPWSERSEILPFIPPSAHKILDVGCGPGAFGVTLKAADPLRTVWGIEPVVRYARQAVAHYDKIVVGPFPDALESAHPAEKFDCIVFNDVLEHMVDPWAALDASASLLTENGTIVASIPNVRYVRNVFGLVVRGDWTYTDLGILDRTHLRFFTRRTMTSLFENSGYLVSQIRGINSIGRSRSRFAGLAPWVLRDFAFSGFVVVAARPTTEPASPQKDGPSE